MVSVKKGKGIVTFFIVLFLIMDVLISICAALINVGSIMMEDVVFVLVEGSIRIILTGILLFFLYKGHRWAKWLIIVLMLISVLMSMLSLLVSFSLIMLIMGIFFLISAITLIASQSVNRFFKSQRGEFTPDDISSEDITTDDIGKYM